MATKTPEVKTPEAAAETSAPAAQTPAVTLTADQFEVILTRLAALQTNNQGGITADVLKDVLKENAEALRSVIRENKEGVNYEGISHLNPDGELTRPRGRGDLRFHDAQGNPREVFFRTFLREQMLSPAEIEACNAIQEDCQARDGRWTAKIDKGGATKTRLVIKLDDVNNRDGRMSLPSFFAIVTELKGGPKTADLATVIARVKELEREVARMQNAK